MSAISSRRKRIMQREADKAKRKISKLRRRGREDELPAPLADFSCAPFSTRSLFTVPEWRLATFDHQKTCSLDRLIHLSKVLTSEEVYGHFLKVNNDFTEKPVFAYFVLISFVLGILLK